ncbi:MAG: hypothetical protein CL916_02650 [Deltaproteobacteria bacterium]|nr:hypothetical protein [Deltaproteobacteria bacterium]
MICALGNDQSFKISLITNQNKKYQDFFLSFFLSHPTITCIPVFFWVYNPFHGYQSGEKKVQNFTLIIFNKTLKIEDEFFDHVI